MTRWATDDLAGRLIEDCDRRHKRYRLLTYKAWDGKRMLCDEILNKAQYDGILNSDTSPEITRANYDQEPIDAVGRLYTGFQEYEVVPEDIQFIDCYTDTADEGNDYLCSIIYAVCNADAYVLDVIYTRDAMEITEPLLASKITEHKVNHCRVESNNGGRGFGRSVMRIAREDLNNDITSFSFFYQDKNKVSRISTNSTGVMRRIKFPTGWQVLYPDYFKAMYRYQAGGSNAHDDAPDATTGVYEYLPRKVAKRESQSTAGIIPW